MKYWLITLAMLAGWGGLGSAAALAQFGYNPPQVNPNPTLSPYLNLVPNNPYINYFGIAQTQVSNTRGLQQLQQQMVTNQPGYYPFGMSNPGLQPNMMNTGHMVTFQNVSHYFPTTGSSLCGHGHELGGRRLRQLQRLQFSQCQRPAGARIRPGLSAAKLGYIRKIRNGGEIFRSLSGFGSFVL